MKLTNDYNCCIISLIIILYTHTVTITQIQTNPVIEMVLISTLPPIQEPEDLLDWCTFHQPDTPDFSPDARRPLIAHGKCGALSRSPSEKPLEWDNLPSTKLHLGWFSNLVASCLGLSWWPLDTGWDQGMTSGYSGAMFSIYVYGTGQVKRHLEFWGEQRTPRHY